MTPFYQALSEYRDKGLTLLHMPGHKGGRGFLFPDLKYVGGIDFTEVPGLDDWHCPAAALKEAQGMMAEAYGAEASYFLVNGATSGIHALFMALGEGSQVIIPRNVHRSFFGGMVLAGSVPCYFETRLDPEWGLPLTTETVEIEQALARYPEARAVFLVSPTYFGTCSHVGKIAELVHKNGLDLLVDEAHGAHFGFHPAYPQSALANGAQAVVHGVHKTLPALTGAGCLHIGQGFSAEERVFSALDILITTSPSMPIMASLDWARAWVTSEEGYRGLDRMAELSRDFDKILLNIKGLMRIRVPGEEQMNDLSRVTIGIRELTINGWELADLLYQEYGIVTEMAGENHVVALFTPFNSPDDWHRLAKALISIAHRYGGKRERTRFVVPAMPQMALKPREAYWAGKKRVPLSEAAGKISGEIVAPYPPGIPCLLPGEVITEEMVDYLVFLRAKGARWQGMLDPKAKDIYVIDI